MWISKEKYNKELGIAYEKGKIDGLFEEKSSNRTYFLQKEAAVFHIILPELAELKHNTWDKDRVERIRQLLFNNLFWDGSEKEKEIEDEI